VPSRLQAALPPDRPTIHGGSHGGLPVSINSTTSINRGRKGTKSERCSVLEGGIIMVKVVDKSVLAGSSISFADEIRGLDARGVAYQCFEVMYQAFRGAPDSHALVLWIPSGGRGWINHNGYSWSLNRQLLDELGYPSIEHYLQELGIDPDRDTDQQGVDFCVQCKERPQSKLAGPHYHGHNLCRRCWRIHEDDQNEMALKEPRSPYL
jgi:hypothetical protein